MGLSVLGLKIIFVVVSFIEAAGLGLVPVYSKSFQESPKILGVANAFSGGVFLAIALMHIMPEQEESYSDLYPDSKFPMPFFLMVCGYTLILIIDKVLFDTHVILGDDHGDEGHHHKEITVDGAALSNSHSHHSQLQASKGSALKKSVAAAIRQSIIASSHNEG